MNFLLLFLSCFHNFLSHSISFVYLKPYSCTFTDDDVCVENVLIIMISTVVWFFNFFQLCFNTGSCKFTLKFLITMSRNIETIITKIISPPHSKYYFLYPSLLLSITQLPIPSFVPFFSSTQNFHSATSSFTLQFPIPPSHSSYPTLSSCFCDTLFSHSRPPLISYHPFCFILCFSYVPP